MYNMAAKDNEEKSDDKKVIEDEEREKMLNSENEAKAAEAAEKIKPAILDLEEGREVKPKKIPIGGIKMPGFFTRSKSKEGCKDDQDDEEDKKTEVTIEEEKSQLEEKVQHRSFKLPNPFNKQRLIEESDGTPEKEKSRRRSLLDSIRLPLVSAFPPRFRTSTGREQTLGAPQAGLASVETLGDDRTDDGMENIKLDSGKPEEPEKPLPVDEETWKEKFTKHRVIIGAVAAFLLVLIIILIYALSGPAYPSESPVENGRYVTAITSCGKIQGILEDGSVAFRGIPYALPPTGERRFLPAKPLNKLAYCWNGTFLAHNSTPLCWQIYSNGTSAGVEDCLTLDVVTPYVRYDTPLPVVVLIGSESYTGGTPGRLRPSARYAKSRDVVFVRPNFRVGALGFLAVTPLTKSTYPNSSGNYGLTDIVEALNWIQLNIEHFGGNKSSVTLLGHRTGATLVTALSSFRKAKGLFTKAWATSGSVLFPGKELGEYERANRQYLDIINCIDSDCLRSKDAEALVQAVPDTWRKMAADLPTLDEEPEKRHEWLVLDGDVLVAHPVELWRDKHMGMHVKLVLGTTAHASESEKLYLRHKEWTPALIREHVQNSLLGKRKLADEALQKYNATYNGLAAMISDIRTVCPLFGLSSQLENSTFYVATMTRGEKDRDIADADADIEAILGRFEAKTPEQRRYVSAMQQLFYHFVWHDIIPQASNSTNVLIVDQDTLPAANYSHCDFWISKDIVPLYANLD